MIRKAPVLFIGRNECSQVCARLLKSECNINAFIADHYGQSDRVSRLVRELSVHVLVMDVHVANILYKDIRLLHPGVKIIIVHCDSDNHDELDECIPDSDSLTVVVTSPTPVKVINTAFNLVPHDEHRLVTA